MQTQKKSASKSKRATIRARKAGGNELKALRRENKKLHLLLSDIWDVLHNVRVPDKKTKMFKAIDTACHFMIEDLPEIYRYDETEQLPVSETNKDAALKVAINRARRSIVRELGVPESDLPEVSFDQFIQAQRRVIARALGVKEFVVEGTPQAYREIVAGSLWNTIIHTAQIPTTLKDEAIKFAEEAKRIKTLIPQGRRSADKNTELALGLRDALLLKWSQIYPQAIPGYDAMTPRERRSAEKQLRHRVSALRSSRANKKGAR